MFINLFFLDAGTGADLSTPTFIYTLLRKRRLQSVAIIAAQTKAHSRTPKL